MARCSRQQGELTRHMCCRRTAARSRAGAGRVPPEAVAPRGSVRDLLERVPRMDASLGRATRGCDAVPIRAQLIRPMIAQLAVSEPSKEAISNLAGVRGSRTHPGLQRSPTTVLKTAGTTGHHPLPRAKLNLDWRARRRQHPSQGLADSNFDSNSIRFPSQQGADAPRRRLASVGTQNCRSARAHDSDPARWACHNAKRKRKS